MSYFTISEMLYSATAIEKKIWNGAGQEEEENLRALISNVLDPLRVKYGAPIYVSSGFRCAKVNKDAGGVTGSQHLRGEAADLYVTKMVNGKRVTDKEAVYKIGRLIVALGRFDQVIFENVGKDDLLPEWIHVSWRRNGTNRHKMLKKVKGTRTYQSITKKDLGLS